MIVDKILSFKLVSMTLMALLSFVTVVPAPKPTRRRRREDYPEKIRTAADARKLAQMANDELLEHVLGLITQRADKGDRFIVLNHLSIEQIKALRTRKFLVSHDEERHVVIEW